jgi:hypothetical protein
MESILAHPPTHLPVLQSRTNLGAHRAFLGHDLAAFKQLNYVDSGGTLTRVLDIVADRPPTIHNISSRWQCVLDTGTFRAF